MSNSTHGWESMTPTDKKTVIANSSGLSLRGIANSKMTCTYLKNENAAPESTWTVYVELDAVSIRATGPTITAADNAIIDAAQEIIQSWTRR